MKKELSIAGLITSCVSTVFLFMPVIFKWEHSIKEGIFWIFEDMEIYNIFCGGKPQGISNALCWGIVICGILGVIGWLFALLNDKKNGLIAMTVLSAVLFFILVIINVMSPVKFSYGRWDFYLEWGFYIAAALELASATMTIVYVRKKQISMQQKK